jgi:hypothetical protein
MFRLEKKVTGEGSADGSVFSKFRPLMENGIRDAWLGSVPSSFTKHFDSDADANKRCHFFSCNMIGQRKVSSREELASEST